MQRISCDASLPSYLQVEVNASNTITEARYIKLRIYEFAIIPILMMNADGICIKLFIYIALLYCTFIKLTLCFTVFAIISSTSIKKAFYKNDKSINTMYVI